VPTPEAKYLRTKCGLPGEAPTLPPDPDDPATVLLSTEQAAAAAHVDPEVIRQWASRRLILPVPCDPASPAPRYRELDVLDAEVRTRRERRLKALIDEAWAQAGMP